LVTGLYRVAAGPAIKSQ